jgi:hypothetical protein
MQPAGPYCKQCGGPCGGERAETRQLAGYMNRGPMNIMPAGQTCCRKAVLFPPLFCFPPSRGVFLPHSGGMDEYSSKPGDAEATQAEIHSSLDEEVHNASGLEKGERNSSEGSVSLKLDQHGLPLVPQPSKFKDDPLVRYPKSISGTSLTRNRTGRSG